MCILGLAACLDAGPGRGVLPVYIEDSHAGSFYWIADHIPPDSPHTLILFDAHCDAMELFGSDETREAIRQGQTATRTANWRASGHIQCFDWIEPLMPLPLSRVLWIAPDAANLDSLRRIVTQQILCHQEAVPRKCGDLSNVYSLCSLDGLSAGVIPTPLIASIDLDYFSQIPAGAEERIDSVVSRLFALKNLKAVTVAISTPFHPDRRRADALLARLFERLSLAMNARFEFEPFLSAGPDRSLKAESFLKKGSPPPHFDLSSASLTLQSALYALRDRIAVGEGSGAWSRFLLGCRSTASLPVAASPAGGLVSPGTDPARLRWFALRPLHKHYNVVGPHGFSDSAGPIVTYAAVPITGSFGKAAITANDVRPFFHADSGYGTVYCFAEGLLGRERIRSDIRTIEKRSGSDFRGALSGIVNLPYVYGSSMLWDAGARQFFGVDCANFIVAARRAQGFATRSCNPPQLRAYLNTLAIVKSFVDGVAVDKNVKPVTVTNKQLFAGVILHFQSHVAAVYRDTPPLGVLNKTDIVIHKLEDKPEFIELGEMPQASRVFEVTVFRK